jgi:hypothetical protein
MYKKGVERRGKIGKYGERLGKVGKLERREMWGMVGRMR